MSYDFKDMSLDPDYPVEFDVYGEKHDDNMDLFFTIVHEDRYITRVTLHRNDYAYLMKVAKRLGGEPLVYYCGTFKDQSDLDTVFGKMCRRFQNGRGTVEIDEQNKTATGAIAATIFVNHTDIGSDSENDGGYVSSDSQK